MQTIQPNLFLKRRCDGRGQAETLKRITALLLVALLLATPLAAQQGLVMKGAVFFAGRQGRWTLLTAWTILFATEENEALALDAARKAEQIAEASADDARTATSLRYLAVLDESKGRYAEAEAAVQRALSLRQNSIACKFNGMRALFRSLAARRQPAA